MAVTIVRTATSSQIGSLLTQASASNTYLTKISASTNYLSQASASTIYLPQASASITYLTQASASTTYLPQASASSTYQPKDADLTAIAEGGWTSGLLNKIAPNTWGTITDNSTNWNTAYTDRNKWDGGATGLTAATGRTSLGLGTMATETAANYLTTSSASTTYATKASPSLTGTVTMPSQPYFHARSTQATAVGNDVLWSVIDNNVGSSYTSANGRFTAPVAGTYFFSAHGLWNNADAGDMRIALYKNAAGINGNRFILTKTASNWMTFYLNDIIYLAAGDYVTVRYLQGTNTLHVDADYNGFRGWLLG